MRSKSAAAERQCFPLRVRIAAQSPVSRLQLADGPALALAELLPLLGCGEEAAALAFDALADAAATPARAVLRRIGDEERLHDALIAGLLAELPAVDATARLRDARRFHAGLGHGTAAMHLARIAALDAAVCTLLSRLTRPGTPIGDDPGSGPVLRRIRNDEARHVRISRAHALASGDASLLRDVAAPVRVALADIIALAGAAFDRLGVDPDALFRDLRRLPDGLLRA